MRSDQLVTQFEEFQKLIKDYRSLLLKSRNSVNDIVENHAQIDIQRSILNRKHAGLQKYIQKFGRNPRMNDGVWNHVYSCYSNAFSADILQRVGPSIDGVLQDLDYILGTLITINEKEFQKMLENQQKKMEAAQPTKKNHWNFVNPFWLSWEFLKLLWKHKIIAGIATLGIGLATAYLTHIFGWNN